MNLIPPSTEDLLRQNEELTIRLQEAEDALQAIRNGEVDAIIVSGEQGEQVFSLAGAESVYRLIVQTMKEAALTLTPDGKVLFSNGRFCEMIHAAPEQVLGRPLAEFVTPEYHESLDRVLRDSHAAPVKTRVVFQADGHPVPAHVSSNVLRQADGVSICLVAADLSELEASTEMLQKVRASEERFRSLFDQSMDAVLFTVPDGGILAANPAACAMFGRTEAELCKLGRAGILDPSDPRLAPALEERKRTGRISTELTALRHNGEKFPAEVSSVILPGDPPRSFVILRDITARKQAEQKLKATNAELERFNKHMVGREMRMIELKKEVNELCRLAGQPQRYPSQAIEEPMV